MFLLILTHVFMLYVSHVWFCAYEVLTDGQQRLVVLDIFSG